MLKNLTISDIVLIEKVDISFKSGFNVISGETGAGKSVIMEALAQVMGEKSNSNLVRLGASKGTIQATFDIGNIDGLKNLLEDFGVEHDDTEDLIIKKEIALSGKSRSFINNQQVISSVLKKVSAHLFQVVSQHAKSLLFDPNKHLEILDLYGDLEDERKEFSTLLDQERKLKKELENLQSNQEKRQNEINIFKRELQEIEQANIKENEEDELFLEYCKINNIEELRQLSDEINKALTGDQKSVIATCTAQLQNFEKLVELDSCLEESYKIFKSTKLELEEVAYTLNAYQSRLEYDPGNFEEINERLKTYNILRKKYGPDVIDVLRYRDNLTEKLDKLEGADNTIEDFLLQITKAGEKLDLQARKLGENRRAAGKNFEAEITTHLQSLNMKKSEFFTRISAHERTKFGDDHIEFYFRPNVGEKEVSIRKSASGGELSRIMMSKACVMSAKERVPTIIFDEIDANVGGKTATIMGEKLKSIGGNCQILCITHFPQVAAQSLHHIKISKEEKNGRTLTFAHILDDRLRKEELARMMGK